MSFLTVIIPTLIDVDGEYMKYCVQSLRDSGFGEDIIVVANGTKDMNPFRGVQGITKAITVKKQGQCFAVNQGAKMVEGDCKYILVANADMYFAPGWDKHLNGYLETAEDGRKRFIYQCFSPNLVEPTNNPGSAAPFLKVDGGFTLEEFDKTKVDKFIEKNVSHVRVNNLVETGFNLPFIMDIELWRTIGGYDEFYDPWGSNSDTDLQTAVNLAGVIPMRLRDVLVYHFSNKSGTFDGSHQEAWQRNWDYYQQKWGFNRDDLNSDVWMNERMLPKNPEDIKYQPDWVGKYADS
jgi:glycosyltransferase involved in cell wall biosynthesis